MGDTVLDRRSLNRATLARQLLLERHEMPAMDAVEQLVGLQAQEPPDPYHALWSRLAGFDPHELGDALVDRRAVRIVSVRGTIHLHTAADALVLRALAQPVLDAEIERHRDFGPPLRGVDLTAPLQLGRELLGERPRTMAELRTAFAEAFPDLHAGALAYACRCKLGLVQVPPRAVWGKAGQVRLSTVEAWLGAPLAAEPSIDGAIVRYFAAFGPASISDAATWSRLTRLREVVERVRPRLRVLRDERGRELFDVPDAPLPDPDTPAPPRFLPMYDNVLLSHDNRSRFFPGDDAVRRRLSGGDRTVRGSVLHDGFVCGTWRLDRDGAAAPALVVDHTGLGARARSAVEAEGRRVLRFLLGDEGTGDVRFAATD